MTPKQLDRCLEEKNIPPYHRKQILILAHSFGPGQQKRAISTYLDHLRRRKQETSRPISIRKSMSSGPVLPALFHGRRPHARDETRENQSQVSELQKAMAGLDDVSSKAGRVPEIEQTNDPIKVDDAPPEQPMIGGNTFYATARRVNLQALTGHQRAALSAGLDPDTPGLEKMTYPEMKALSESQTRDSVDPRPRYLVSPRLDYIKR